MEEKEFTQSDVDKLLKEQYDHALRVLRELPVDHDRLKIARLELGRCYNHLRLRIRGV